MDRSVLAAIDSKLDNPLFRNKSHFIEVAVREFLGGKNETKY